MRHHRMGRRLVLRYRADACYRVQKSEDRQFLAVPSPEFIHLRYDPNSEKSKIRIAVAIMELVGYFIFSFIQVQGFGIVLSSITGLPYNICCVCFMIILIFTCMGGF